MSILQGFEKELVLRQAGAARKYICTYSDANILKDGGSYLELDLIFVTSDHFGYDTSYTILINDQQFTSSSRTDQISLAGSAPWQQPIIRYTYSALTGGTSKVVTISNDAVGQTLTITRTWAAGDVLTIDPSDTDPVKVNGVKVAFTGAVPEWQVGVGSITYSDTLTTRTVVCRMTYYKRYV